MKQGNRSSVWNTCSNEYTLLRLLFIPKRGVSDIFNHLSTSIMEYIALCASLFLKNALISERKFVTLCTGIGLSFFLFFHYKDTHFLQQTEIPMPFLCTNTSYYCQLAKLELKTLQKMEKKPIGASLEAYVKPSMEIIEMEIEGAILNGSGETRNYDTGNDEDW